MVVWVCGRGFSGCFFCKRRDGILLRRELGVISGQDMEVSWENLEWTLTG